MAIALAHDVSSYCWSHGTAVFLCSLDAAAAFDGIPHPIIFQKAMHVLPKNEIISVLVFSSLGVREIGRISELCYKN